MFSLFCTMLGSSATGSSESFLEPLAKLLCSVPFMLLTFSFCTECELRVALFPFNCGVSPHVYLGQEPSCSHEKILSVSSLHTFNVWQALFLVTAEFLPCTALFVPLEHWPFLHEPSHLLGTAIWFCIVLYIGGSYMVVLNSQGCKFIISCLVTQWGAFILYA